MLQRPSARWLWKAIPRKQISACGHHQCRFERRRRSQASVRTFVKSKRITSSSKHIDSRRFDDSFPSKSQALIIAESSAGAQLPELEEDISVPYATLDGTSIGQELLQSAVQHGLIKIDSIVAARLLDEARLLGSQFGLVALKDFCKRHTIAVDDVYLLACLLLRSRAQKDRHFGWILLRLTSNLGSAKATIEIVKRILRDKDFHAKSTRPEFESSFDYLKRLAERNPPLLPALILQADIEQRLGEHPLAETLYMKAIKSDSSATHSPKITSLPRRIADLLFLRTPIEENLSWTRREPPLEQDSDLDIVAAHVKLGSLYYFSQDTLHSKEKGLEYWRIAALEHDDPTAYFYLAEDLRSSAVAEARCNPLVCDQRAYDERDGAEFEAQWLWYVDTEWYSYALKAAASGIPDACYQIGLLFLLPELYPHLNCNGLADARVRTVVREHPLFDPMLLETLYAVSRSEVNVQWSAILQRVGSRKRLGIEWLSRAERLGHRTAARFSMNHI